MRAFYRSLVSKEEELVDSFMPLCYALRQRQKGESPSDVFKQCCEEYDILGCIIDVCPDIPHILRTWFPRPIVALIQALLKENIFEAEVKRGGTTEHVWSSSMELQAYKRTVHETQTFSEMAWSSEFQGPYYDQMRCFGKALSVKYQKRPMMNAWQMPETFERPICYNFNVDMEGEIFMYLHLRMFFSKESGAAIGVRLDFDPDIMQEIFEYVYKDETKLSFVGQPVVVVYQDSSDSEDDFCFTNNAVPTSIQHYNKLQQAPSPHIKELQCFLSLISHSSAFKGD